LQKPLAVAAFEKRLRQKRFSFLAALIAPLPRPVRILDVGGTVGFWEAVGYKEMEGFEVSLLNLFPQSDLPLGFRSLIGDARDLEKWHPGDYDIVVSNSVINIVGSFQDQKQMADGIRHFAKRYFVQTPNYYFPIDWRTLVPFFHFLPAKQQAWWLYHFSIGPFGRMRPYEKAIAWAERVHDLSYKQLSALFPEADILDEKLCGFTKSFMAVKGFRPQILTGQR
jgi:hypothetical protein